MAWRIVVQPNGCYASFSDIVDDFTSYDMTREEALAECREHLGRLDALAKVLRAEQDPGRFERDLETVKKLEGEYCFRTAQRHYVCSARGRERKFLMVGQDYARMRPNRITGTRIFRWGIRVILLLGIALAVVIGAATLFLAVW